jgi:hypothetical protein
MNIMSMVFFFWYPVWPVFPGSQLARVACHVEGGLNVKETVSAEGYLRTKEFRLYNSAYTYDYPDDDLPRVVDDLLVRKFKFVEEDLQFVEHPTVPKFTGSEKTKDKKPLLHSSRLLRFYLAPAGSEACKNFNERVATSALRKINLKEKGLPDSLCIAVEETNSSLSQYKLSYEGYTTTFLTPLYWHRIKLMNMNTEKMIAQYKSFTYQGTIFGHFGEPVACFDPQEYKKFNESIMPAKSDKFLAMKNADPNSPIYQFYK